MARTKKIFTMILVTGWITLLTSPAFARSFSLKDAGISLWIFIAIGAVIILLQLIPAAILFFSFIGTTTTMAFRSKKVPETEAAKEELTLPGYGPVKAEE